MDCADLSLPPSVADTRHSPDYIGSYSGPNQLSVLPTVITISTDVVRDGEVQVAKDAVAGYVKPTAW